MSNRWKKKRRKRTKHNQQNRTQHKRQLWELSVKQQRSNAYNTIKKRVAVCGWKWKAQTMQIYNSIFKLLMVPGRFLKYHCHWLERLEGHSFRTASEHNVSLFLVDILGPSFVWGIDGAHIGTPDAAEWIQRAIVFYIRFCHRSKIQAKTKATTWFTGSSCCRCGNECVSAPDGWSKSRGRCP